MGAVWMAAHPCLSDGPLPTVPVNMGFEEGKKGWQVPSALWRIEEGTGRNGSKCLVWENSDPGRFHYSRQALALEAGGVYRYGVWIKTESMVSGDKLWPWPRVSLEFFDAEGK